VHDNLGPPHDLVLRDAEVDGVVGDVLVHEAMIASVGLPVPRAVIMIDCGGAAVIPGLHDHHCRLLSAAAAADSVLCGPPAVRARTGLRKALSSQRDPMGGFVASGTTNLSPATLTDGSSTRSRLAVPTRVQHRSGALWVLNSVGLATLGIEDQPGDTYPDGVERDATGRLTGRLWRLDRWLRDRVPIRAVPDLADLSRTPARYGITGVADATPNLGDEAIALLTGGEL
jgi:predicted amidohydrolase YtcJ